MTIVSNGDVVLTFLVFTLIVLVFVLLEMFYDDYKS